MANLHTSKKSICVFCGSRTGLGPDYMALAAKTGKTIADQGFRLVYGGGGVGLMGETARSAHGNGGEVLGIMPEFLTQSESILLDVPHEIVADMHVRKRMMYDASQAFIVLPGGIGTLEEAVEVMSWMRLQIHAKPMVFLSDDGYWQPLMDLLHHTIDKAFSPAWMRGEILRAETPEASLELIRAHWDNPPPQRKLSQMSVDLV